MPDSWVDQKVQRAEERREFGESVPDEAVLRKRFTKEYYETLKRQFYKAAAGAVTDTSPSSGEAAAAARRSRQASSRVAHGPRAAGQ